MKWLVAVAFLALVTARHFKPTLDWSRPARPLAAKTKAQPVLVELFTSEGCSTCPPADALLARLEKDQPVEEAEIIAVEEHVDYWNQQGWMDPFSSAEWTLRQQQYISRFKEKSVYTPQMVRSISLPAVAPRLPQKALFIHSKDDAVIPVSDGLESALAWPESKFVEVDGLGHRRILRSPEVCEEALKFVSG
jgi:pimeloyl-ACP methyl ester carboxylesterase